MGVALLGKADVPGERRLVVREAAHTKYSCPVEDKVHTILVVTVDERYGG